MSPTADATSSDTSTAGSASSATSRSGCERPEASRSAAASSTCSPSSPTRVNPGEDDIDIPPNFYVNDDFYGLLTGTADDDVVTVVFGGFGCGEWADHEP